MEWCEHLAKHDEVRLLLEPQPGKDGQRLFASSDGVLSLARRNGSQHQKGSRAGMLNRAKPVDSVHRRYRGRWGPRYDELARTDSDVSDNPTCRARDQAAGRVFCRTVWPIKKLP